MTNGSSSPSPESDALRCPRCNRIVQELSSVDGVEMCEECVDDQYRQDAVGRAK
jgi:hypothetical protein